MSTVIHPQPQIEIVYPESDGKPMADNTEQFEWIVKIKEGLEFQFANDPNVFVAGDLLWYPVENNNKCRVAPDAMVVFGRPKGRRGSYLQWNENGIAPQVVFEVLSPGNRLSEMAQKLEFYDMHGVEEYYLIDPSRMDASGWIRQDDRLHPIESLHQWVSPRLGIRFETEFNQIQLFHPDGSPFESFTEVSQQLERERQRTERLLAQLRAAGLTPEE